MVIMRAVTIREKNGPNKMDTDGVKTKVLVALTKADGAKLTTCCSLPHPKMYHHK